MLVRSRHAWRCCAAAESNRVHSTLTQHYSKLSTGARAASIVRPVPATARLGWLGTHDARSHQEAQHSEFEDWSSVANATLAPRGSIPHAVLQTLHDATQWDAAATPLGGVFSTLLESSNRSCFRLPEPTGSSAQASAPCTSLTRTLSGGRSGAQGPSNVGEARREARDRGA